MKKNLLPGCLEQASLLKELAHFCCCLLHFFLQDKPSWYEYDPAWQQILLEGSECFIKKTAGTISVNGTLVKFSGADHPALYTVSGKRFPLHSHIEHDCGRPDLLFPVFANKEKLTLECQSILFCGSLLQFRYSRYTCRTIADQGSDCVSQGGNASVADQARASLFLPLALRLLRTLRPPRVAILARKPHLCAFLILEGWKVLFMMSFPFSG